MVAKKARGTKKIRVLLARAVGARVDVSVKPGLGRVARQPFASSGGARKYQHDIPLILSGALRVDNFQFSRLHHCADKVRYSSSLRERMAWECVIL